MTQTSLAQSNGSPVQTTPRISKMKPGRILLYAILTLALVYYAIPLLLVVSTSLKTSEEIRVGTIFTLPQSLNFDAWTKAWLTACTGIECNGIHGNFWNSVQIVVPSVIFSILFGALTGFALSQWQSKLSRVMLLSLMLGAFIPYQVILYPLVRIFSSVGLYGTLPGIVLIHIIFGLPYMALLFFNFYQGVPPELSKAAKMDGAGFFTIFFQIMLPMSVNVLVVAIIMQATGIWNDFLLGLIFAGRDHLPITVQLNNIVNTTTGVKEYNVNMAATFLTALPPLLIYIVSGRYFARGLAAGAVKG
ncbi:carbohydrate ABC transporter permease [Rhizobium rhizogenes]|uniref:carbohydrate ABC transporter permease n=1 Tax=Rhizobium rhizogenes TaxID=359 RepID=UPI00064753AA|nr:carbohydrate ABC transporter permease [Rhizobium rhizogenes]